LEERLAKFEAQASGVKETCNQAFLNSKHALKACSDLKVDLSVVKVRLHELQVFPDATAFGQDSASLLQKTNSAQVTEIGTNKELVPGQIRDVVKGDSSSNVIARLQQTSNIEPSTQNEHADPKSQKNRSKVTKRTCWFFNRKGGCKNGEMCNFKHEKKNTKKGSRADDKKEAPKDKKAKSSSSQSNQLTEGTTVHIGGEDFRLVKSTGTKTQRNNSSKNQQSSYKPSAKDIQSKAPKDPKIGAEQNRNNSPKNVQQKNGSEGKEQINFRDPEISRYNTGSQYWPPVPLAFQQHMFGPRPFQLPFGHPYGGMLY